MCPAMEIDLDYQCRLDPDRLTNAALLGRDRPEGDLIGLQLHQFTEKLACRVVRKAGACTTGIVQLSVVIETENQRPNGPGVRGRRHDTCDDQLLAVRAFGLDPFAPASGTVRRICDFRNNALQAQFARVPEERGTWFGQG